MDDIPLPNDHVFFYNVEIALDNFLGVSGVFFPFAYEICSSTKASTYLTELCFLLWRDSFPVTGN